MDENTLKFLNTLAEKLGVTATHLWSVLVRQAKIEAIQDILCTIFLSFLIFIYFKNIKKLIEKDEEYSWVILIIGGLVSVIMFIICICLVFGSIPTELLNPEYWALKQLLPNK